jgi:hypothetical protein
MIYVRCVRILGDGNYKIQMDLTFINNKFLYKQVNPLLHIGFPAFFNKNKII